VLPVKVGAIIQARMESKRLPGKILLEMAGAPLLERLLTRVRSATMLDEVIVATTTSPSDDPVEALCEALRVKCFRGKMDDVLGRMISAAEKIDADIVVRLTADNPFVGGDLIDLVLHRFFDAYPKYSYAHNVTDSGFPYGLFVEAVIIQALREAATSDLPEDREHVTWYVRQRPEQFESLTVCSPVQFPDISMTVDTAEDYRRASPIFEHLHKIDPNFTIEDLAGAAAKLAESEISLDIYPGD
jgi:spore coat polysaccharide biosynthesis protein SpsF